MLYNVGLQDLYDVERYYCYSIIHNLYSKSDNTVHVYDFLGDSNVGLHYVVQVVVRESCEFAMDCDICATIFQDVYDSVGTASL